MIVTLLDLQDSTKRNYKPKQRRITVTRNIVWGMYVSADEASDGNWISDEEREKMRRLHNKIYGRR